MAQFFTKYFPNVVPIWSGDGGVTQAINETLYMTALTAIVAGILGIVIGILLVLTDEGGLLANHPFYFILDKLVNIFRAVPFIILLAFIAPVTQAIVGTQIGTTAALVPLSIGFFAFYARQVQVALKSVDQGKIEAAQAAAQNVPALQKL